MTQQISKDPVEIKGRNLIIDPSKMETGVILCFRFLKANYQLEKLPNGKVVLLEECGL